LRGATRVAAGLDELDLDANDQTLEDSLELMPPFDVFDRDPFDE
jgi:hypothetical protein